MPRLFFGSVAEALALHVDAPALLVPAGGRSFVDGATGALTLRRILVAVGDAEAGEAGAERAAWVADLVGASEVDVELLHVGSAKPAPRLSLPQRRDTRFHVRTAEGSIEDAIVATAEALNADLIVMATRGHNSIADVMTGSHTERVLRRAHCPVLSVPLR
ncbi:MAG: universal stress protein [Polyangiaceae bacterium]|nr:universal stress protein [Polyangiaceae bacterium]